MTEPRHQLTRRDLLRASIAVGTAATVGMTTTKSIAADQTESKLKSGSVILFQGDSITDARRNHKSTVPNDAGALGNGYPFLLASDLLRDYADPELKVFNRGISGHKVPDLQARWQKDCIDIKPDVLSILVGVNDIWHKLNGRYTGTVKDYEVGFRELLKQTQAKLPNTRIVVCEPFVLRCGSINDKWFPEFDERRAVATKLATELKLTFVPFQAMFDKATKNAPPAFWARDGVHPSLAGHALMARTWREVTGI